MRQVWLADENGFQKVQEQHENLLKQGKFF